MLSIHLTTTLTNTHTIPHPLAAFKLFSFLMLLKLQENPMSRSIKSIYLKQVYIVKHPIVYKFVSSLTDSSGLSIYPCTFLLFCAELNFQIKTDIVEDNWQFYLFMLILSSRRLKGTKRKTELDTSINESFFYPILDRQKMGQQ